METKKNGAELPAVHLFQYQVLRIRIYKTAVSFGFGTSTSTIMIRVLSTCARTSVIHIIPLCRNIRTVWFQYWFTSCSYIWDYSGIWYTAVVIRIRTLYAYTWSCIYLYSYHTNPRIYVRSTHTQKKNWIPAIVVKSYKSVRMTNCTPRHREATRRPSHILRDRHYVLFYCSFVALFCLGSGHRRPLLTSASVFIGALNTSHKYKKHNNSNRCQQRTIPAALVPRAPTLFLPNSPTLNQWR